MTKTYSYACSDYPEMDSCPSQFTSETKEELWKHIELHAVQAHGEDPSSWTSEDRGFLDTLIVSE